MFLRDVEHPERVVAVIVKHRGEIEIDQGSLLEIQVRAPLGIDWLWQWTQTNGFGAQWIDRVECGSIIGAREHVRGPNK